MSVAGLKPEEKEAKRDVPIKTESHRQAVASQSESITICINLQQDCKSWLLNLAGPGVKPEGEEAKQDVPIKMESNRQAY